MLPEPPNGDPLAVRDERGRNVLGFIEQRCPYCQAPLYLADEPESRPICLNACTLPAWQYRLLMQATWRAGLQEE